jgi:pantetheine-phosphate adenylyltransferase
MQVAIVPGSFDPITSGHLNIIERAAKIFNKVVVGVALSPNKKTLFSLDQRVKAVKEAVANLPNVHVESFDSLLVEFATKHRANVVIKGLRAVTDFEHEFQMAQLNRQLKPHVETFFMMADPKYAYLSSSAVKEIAKFGGNIAGLVPPNVEKLLRDVFA